MAIQPFNASLLQTLGTPRIDFLLQQSQIDSNTAQRNKMLAELAYLPAQQRNEELKTMAWLAQSGYGIDPKTGQLTPLPEGKSNLDSLYKRLQMENLIGQIEERGSKNKFIPMQEQRGTDFVPQEVRGNVAAQQGMQQPVAPELPTGLANTLLKSPAAGQESILPFPQAPSEIIDAPIEQVLSPIEPYKDVQKPVGKKAPIEDYNEKVSLYESAEPGMLNGNSVMRLPDGRVLTQAQFDKEAAKVQKEGAYYNATKKKVEGIVPIIDDAIKQIEDSEYALSKMAVRYKDDPLSPAHEIDKMLDGVRSNLGFDNLNEMRQQSPTGGALGQVAVKELDLLQATKGSLDIGAGKKELLKSLKRIRNGYTGMAEDLGVDLGDGAKKKESAPSGVSEGATATNPQTGEKLIFKGGAWLPM